MIPPPTDAEVIAFLRDAGLPSDGPVEPGPHEGSVSYVRVVGDLIVKPLKEPDFASDVRTEAVACPAVQRVGARVPTLRHFDPDRLWTVYDRLPGLPLGQLPHVADLRAIYADLGAQIYLWTSRLAHVDDPQGWLDRPAPYDLTERIEAFAPSLTREDRLWLERVASRLLKARFGPARFVHWDLHAHNLLVHEDRLVAVLDWGDAGFGDGAINYHCVPAEHLPETFREDPNDPDLLGRVVAQIVAYALPDYGQEPDPRTPLRNLGYRRWESVKRLRARPDLPDAYRHWLEP